MKKIISSIFAIIFAVSSFAAEPKDLTIYINPGHGGYDSDDRVITVYPFASGDTLTFAESKSNLLKGFRLREMLWEQGYNVVMSRVKNTSDDDLGLGTIGRLANSAGADLFLSIHSNATGTTARRNFPLMLFRGYDDQDVIAGSKEWATVANNHLLTNKVTVWTSTNLNVRGDYSFYGWKYDDGSPQGLGVLTNLTMTGMLSEGSFHDYIPETYRLLNEDYCWLEAWNFRKAINQYFGHKGVDYGAIIGHVIDERVLRSISDKMYNDDLLEPVNGCKVELYDESGTTKIDERTTDELFNGVYAFRRIVPGNYKLKFSGSDHYASELDITVTSDEVTYANMKLKKMRKTPPQVVSYTPVWKEGDEPIVCNTSIRLNFNWDMDVESTEAAFSIEPAIDGTITWEDQNYTMVFKPSGLYNVNTVYTVKLATSASHPDGLSLENPFEFKFLTAATSNMEIVDQFPKDGDRVHYDKPVFKLIFDRYPSTVGPASYFKIYNSAGTLQSLGSRSPITGSSAVKDEYGWLKYTCTKQLVIGEEYKMVVLKGLKDKDGITLKEDVTVYFTAVDASKEETKNDGTIDEMEDATRFVLKESDCNNLTTGTASNATDKLFGANSVKFTYEFATEEGGEALWSYSAPSEAAMNTSAITSNDALGVHINGDFSGNEVYLVLTSSIEDKYVKVCDIDFYGWKYIQVNLDGLSANVDHKFTGIKLVQKTGVVGKTGAISFDNLNVIVDGTLGVETVEMPELSVYPNPVSEYLIVNAGGIVDRVELYSMNGIKVANAQGNILNVSEIAEGNYIAKIYTGTGCAMRKVVVKH